MSKSFTSRRRWTHKSVTALMRAANSTDPIEIIRSKSREVVMWAKRHGWKGPPYNQLELASLRGIQSRQEPGLFSSEAQLTPMDGRQLLLEFNPHRCSSRRNYSISHEITHTLFDDCFEIVRHRKSSRNTFDPEFELEQLCQIGAAEFLMPREDFLNDLEKFKFSLRSVSSLTTRYDASREAVCRRMLDLGNRTAALVFLSNRLKPIELRDAPDSEPKMRILYSVPTANFSTYLPEHKSVPDDSCIYRATVVDAVAEGEEEWNLPGFGKYFVEAMALPIPPDSDSTTPSVVALIHVR